MKSLYEQNPENWDKLANAGSTNLREMALQLLLAHEKGGSGMSDIELVEMARLVKNPGHYSRGQFRERTERSEGRTLTATSNH